MNQPHFGEPTMATLLSSSFFPLSLLVLFISVLCIRCGAVGEDRKVYIAYMGALPAHPDAEYSLTSQHLSLVQEVLEDSSIANSFVRSYQRSFNGFAVKLNEKERQKLASKEGVLSVFPSRTLQIQTTRSWDFMGFSEDVKRNSRVESDVIVGVLDTGIWPESESFSDEGFGPAPKKWKGACEGGTNFTCNNKIIGARFYSKSGTENSARDLEGHGTHTASTAAGNLVSNVGFYGVAQGNARGGVPSARIAVYQVCRVEGCAEADILAAFDDAIADGVDIITISVGANVIRDFDEDSIAIGAFHAMKKGIFTSHSAGNSGPTQQSTVSLAPWLLTVAASTTDRHIISKVVLGDGTQIEGHTINGFTLDGTKHPLVYGKEAASRTCDENLASQCVAGCLESELVKGKIVVCDNTFGGVVTQSIDALGVIISSTVDVNEHFSRVSPLPATLISSKNGNRVKSYWSSTKNPQANILKSESVNDSSFAPTVIYFSSRGPNGLTPDILKPDISAPGVEILAAFTPVGMASGIDLDKRSVKYNILSGTSMSCPHAAGAAAYVKSFHPDWSPSAIKSALMTTAWSMNSTRNPDAEFAYGAGHIDPVKAINPGLIYEALQDDYVKFLCNLGWDSRRIKIISGDDSTCPKSLKEATTDLNYPSLTVHLQRSEPFVVNFTRRVSNVGSAKSTYEASIISDSKIKISVTPKVLSFKSLKEEKSFVVTVSGSGLPKDSISSAALVWSDGTHIVRSPIVVHSFSIGNPKD